MSIWAPFDAYRLFIDYLSATYRHPWPISQPEPTLLLLRLLLRFSDKKLAATPNRAKNLADPPFMGLMHRDVA